MGDKTLTKGTDYTVSYDGNTDAGEASVTVTGKGNYKDTATGSFTIDKATLTAEGTGTAKGTYGQQLSELTVEGLTAKLGSTTIDGTWKLTGDTVPNVGDSTEYTATFTPTNVPDNYNTLTAKVKLNIAKVAYTGTTTASTSGKFGTTRTYDLANLLPEGYHLGTITTSDTDSIFNGVPSVTGTTLSYTLADNAGVGKSGTITVPVTECTNYEPFDLKITVTVTDKDIPDLVINPITVTYTGSVVPSSEIHGTATVEGNPVTGKWSFVSGQTLTNVADSGTKQVEFTPDDTNLYGIAHGTVVVTINKAPLISQQA